MRVMMLLKSDAAAEAGVIPDEKLLTAMGEYNQAMAAAGVLIGGEGLHASAKGARVRIEQGKTTVLDGPFAEAKELVAGYFVLKTASLQEATDWAKRIPDAAPPGAAEGELELRPLYEPEDFPIDAAEQPGGWRDREEALRAAPPAPGPEKGLRYVSFLKADKNTEAAMAPSEQLLQEMGALMQEMAEKGVLISGDGLRPSAEGAKLKLRAGGKREVMDGPFSETKELIAGVSMYRAQTKAEAIEWARRCLEIHMRGTGIDHGEIEVRQVFETEEIPVSAQERPDGWRAQEQRLREQLG